MDRVKRVVEDIAGTVTNAVTVSWASEPTPQPSGTLVDPGPARRDPVIELLEANDGRVWQQDVVSELDCSAPSVSRLLSTMEADGEITRYWKRGQKVVASPALGPEAVADYSDRERKQAV